MRSEPSALRKRASAGPPHPRASTARLAIRVGIETGEALHRVFRDSAFGRWLTDEEIEAAVDAATWEPAYLPNIPL